MKLILIPMSTAFMSFLIQKQCDIYIQRDLDVPSSSVPKKYDGTSNMAEFRSCFPNPPPSCVGTEDIYISNSYCNVTCIGCANKITT